MSSAVGCRGGTPRASLPTHGSKCGVCQAEGQQESATVRALPAEEVLCMGETAQGPWPVTLAVRDEWRAWDEP